MNLSFPASYLQAKLNAELPPPHDMTLDERASVSYTHLTLPTTPYV